MSLHTQEMFDNEGPHNTREHSRWVAHVRGQVRIDTNAVARAVAELLWIGVKLSTPIWRLDHESELRARRAKRRRAEADEREAASDFARALGATLGPLITLADPGLLSAGAFGVAARSGAMR